MTFEEESVLLLVNSKHRTNFSEDPLIAFQTPVPLDGTQGKMHMNKNILMEVQVNKKIILLKLFYHMSILWKVFDTSLRKKRIQSKPKLPLLLLRVLKNKNIIRNIINSNSNFSHMKLFLFERLQDWIYIIKALINFLSSLGTC